MCRIMIIYLCCVEIMSQRTDDMFIIIRLFLHFIFFRLIHTSGCESHSTDVSHPKHLYSNTFSHNEIGQHLLFQFDEDICQILNKENESVMRNGSLTSIYVSVSYLI